jgi:hypothetical protein
MVALGKTTFGGGIETIRKRHRLYLARGPPAKGPPRPRVPSPAPAARVKRRRARHRMDPAQGHHRASLVAC